MLGARDLSDLLELRCEAPSVVSVYLDLQDPQTYQRQLQAMIAAALKRDAVFEAFRADFDALRDFVGGFKAERHQGLAAFSCRRSGFWKATPLPERGRNALRLGESPWIAPLINLAEQHQRYGVVLVDRERARFAEVYLGDALEHPAPQAPDSPRIADPLHRHLKAVADHAVWLSRRRSLDRLILGGPADLQPYFLRHLHSRLQDTVIVDDTIGASASLPEVVELVVRVELQARRARESVLVQRLLEAVRADAMGVLGLADTLDAVRRGAARMLLIKEGMARLGRLCRGCRALSLSGRKCPYCWLETEPALDLVAELVDQALDQGCEVVRLRHDHGLDTFGGIGAELSLGSLPARRTAGGKAPVNPA